MKLKRAFDSLEYIRQILAQLVCSSWWKCPFLYFSKYKCSVQANGFPLILVNLAVLICWIHPKKELLSLFKVCISKFIKSQRFLQFESCLGCQFNQCWEMNQVLWTIVNGIYKIKTFLMNLQKKINKMNFKPFNSK